MGSPAEVPEDEKLPPDAPLADRVVEALRTVYDPEIPVNIYELGLIYRCDVDAEGDVEIEMTLTAPACPVAGEMPGQVQQVVQAVDGVRSARVDLIWEPAWDPSRMSDEARIALNMF
ncbi:SUF system Fe-S cluster assembly protein [Niveispirillum sp. SYP-B3756]|uniref:SUF system Fe-S cluster assembly protein n=1 Tax=Niveispirillum sp. SYP-B3756 TaxID=2662178 RepID=UPI00200024B2|nr:SUF system Fe-S cluster assembly protein [Niveispirillum sp. SYP-B3756]